MGAMCANLSEDERHIGMMLRERLSYAIPRIPILVLLSGRVTAESTLKTCKEGKVELLGANNLQVTLTLSRDEMMIIKNALNEVCHGIDVGEFSTRIGAEKLEVEELLKNIREAYLLVK